MTNYSYEYGEYDEAYEQYGDEFEHAENCEWIYDNCTNLMTFRFQDRTQTRYG